MIKNFKNEFPSCNNVKLLSNLAIWLVKCSLEDKKVKLHLAGLKNVKIVDDRKDLEDMEKDMVQFESDDERIETRLLQSIPNNQGADQFATGTCAEFKKLKFEDYPQWEFFGTYGIQWIKAMFEYCEIVGDVGGSEVKVVVSDSGILATHPALQGHIGLGGNADTDHGTHGTIVGSTINMSANLTRKIIGVNSFTNNHIKLISRRTPWLNDEVNETDLLMDKALEAFERNIEQEIHISIQSWGAQRDLSHIQSWTETFKKLHKHNHLFIATAGNNSKELNQNNFFWPCSQPSEAVLCVGAINKDGKKRPTSNWSSEQVHIMAQGDMNWHASNDAKQYGQSSGTSLSGPVVAGVAAMMMSADPSLTNVETKKILMDSSTQQTTYVSLCKSGGALNAYEAMKMVSQRLAQKASNKNKNKNKNKNSGSKVNDPNPGSKVNDPNPGSKVSDTNTGLKSNPGGQPNVDVNNPGGNQGLNQGNQGTNIPIQENVDAQPPPTFFFWDSAFSSISVSSIIFLFI